MRIENTKVIRLTINDDESKVIEFDPTDINFVDGFYELIDMVQDVKVPEGLDTRGQIKFMKQFMQKLNVQIDEIFGEGTCQKAFGRSLSFEQYQQFFEGITPHIKSVREENVSKYTD